MVCSKGDDKIAKEIRWPRIAKTAKFFARERLLCRNGRASEGGCFSRGFSWPFGGLPINGAGNVINGAWKERSREIVSG